MTDYVYSRVSTEDQTTAAQLSDLLHRFPGAELVSETASGAKRRPKLEELVSRLRAGDRLIVAALDRLGRRCSEVVHLVEELERRGVVLVSVREGIDYSTPIGRFVTQVFASFAEMERSLIAERTRAGLRAAREAGKRIGRPPVHSEADLDRALELLDEGLTSRQVERLTGISRSHLCALYRARGRKPA